MNVGGAAVKVMLLRCLAAVRGVRLGVQCETYSAYHEQFGSRTREDIRPVVLEHPAPNPRPRTSYGDDPASAPGTVGGGNGT